MCVSRIESPDVRRQGRGTNHEGKVVTERTSRMGQEWDWFSFISELKNSMCNCKSIMTSTNWQLDRLCIPPLTEMVLLVSLRAIIAAVARPLDPLQAKIPVRQINAETLNDFPPSRQSGLDLPPPFFGRFAPPQNVPH